MLSATETPASSASACVRSARQRRPRNAARGLDHFLGAHDFLFGRSEEGIDNRHLPWVERGAPEKPERTRLTRGVVEADVVIQSGIHPLDGRSQTTSAGRQDQVRARMQRLERIRGSGAAYVEQEISRAERQRHYLRTG